MNFDLNINNYTKNELREMFELPMDFDKHTFETKETKIRDNIVNNKDTIPTKEEYNNKVDQMFNF